MKHYQLGKTQLMVSKITLGCWGFAGGPMWGSQDEADSFATVTAALESGINFFENAQGYGDGASEEILGRALVGRRHQAVIATKVRLTGNAKDIVTACEQSLRRLQTDYIDLLQPHWPNRQIPADETIQALTKLQKTGKIRTFGVSNYGVGDLSEILQHGVVTSNQLPYSLLFRAIEYAIQPLCVQENVGILCFSTLMHGLLAGKFKTPADVPAGRARTRHFSKDRPNTRHSEDGCEIEIFDALEKIRQISETIQQPMALVAVSWVLHQPGVSSVILGARKPEQIQGMTGVTDIKLNPETLQKLADISKPVKQTLGPNPDMWMSESRFR